MQMQFLSILYSIVLFTACSKTVTSDENLPANLDVTYEISESTTGLVSFSAMADNTIEYQLFTGDPNNTDPIISNDGNFEHQYTILETYNVEIRAVGANDRYLKKNFQITFPTDESIDLSKGYSSPLSYEGMELIWNDEFDGNSLNEEFWTFEIGDGCPNLCGWGNNELEYYTKENLTVSEGVAKIEAKKQSLGNREYTSSRVITRDKFFFTYGRVDFRALLPEGQGIWPALWMLGQNQSTVGWPKCGEVDIMEKIGGNNNENKSYGNVFWDNNGVNDFLGNYTLPQGTFDDEFHVFSITWDENNIKWYVDDVEFHSFSIATSDRTEFHEDFFLIMNVAVGGNWPGSPDNSTIFPTSMYIDYVRVFQKQ